MREKFASLAGRKLASGRVARALALIWDFEKSTRVDGLFDAFAIEG